MVLVLLRHRALAHGSMGPAHTFPGRSTLNSAVTWVTISALLVAASRLIATEIRQDTRGQTLNEAVGL